MAARSPAALVVLLLGGLVLPLALPLAQPAPLPAALLPAEVPAGDLVATLSALAPAPAGLLDRARADLLPPFGSPGRALLGWAYAKHTLVIPPGPPVVLTGEVLVDDDWAVHADLTLDRATVRFAGPGLVVEAFGALTILDSTLSQPDPAGAAAVTAHGALRVERAGFDRVALVVRQAPGLAEPSLVADSAFRHGPAGIATDRAALEVRGSSFLNHTDGIDVLGLDPVGAEIPWVHDNTFEMNLFGIHVEEGATGLFEANVARANLLGVFCLSAGAPAAAGGLLRPRFERNNLHSNYGEAVSGLRGVTVTTPVGTVRVSDSACQHDRTYLGPAGAAGDTVFLSPADTFTNRTLEPNPTAAPPLPAPLREVVAAESWGPGPVVLEGPVVVNAPGSLALEGAEVRGPFFVGSKLGGRITVRSAGFDAGATLLLRNAEDAADGVALGGAQDRLPLVMWRCNCTVEDASVAFLGVGALVSAGLLTDDTVWRPQIRGSAFRGEGLAVYNLVARLSFQGGLTEGSLVAVLNVLGTLLLESSTLRDHAIAYVGLVTTLQSTDNRYEGGGIGVVSILDTLSHQRDVFAGYLVGVLPVLDPSVHVALTNFTFNGVGILPAVTVATVTSSNFVDNYLFSLLTLPLYASGADLPSSAACSGCWAPPDESWWGNITYTPALAPNQAPQPSWAGLERVARAGETLDLAGTLSAPAVARSGGTLRVLDATLDLAGHPLGAKGAGATGGPTGRLLLDNATLRHGGFVALNSSSSRVTHSRFEDFLDTPLLVGWQGGSYDCLAFRGSAVALRYVVHRAAPLDGSRWLVDDNDGLVLGLSPQVKEAIAGGLRDGALLAPRDQGLLWRQQAGDAHFHGNNLLGGRGTAALTDFAEQLPGLPLGPVEAQGNWWGHTAGPGAGMGYDYNDSAPLVDPWSDAPLAPEPCVALAPRTLPPADDEPVRLADTTIDPSGQGIARRRWDFGDGSPAVETAAADVEHRFPRFGPFEVTLTAVSASGASATGKRSILVLARPVADFQAPASPTEADLAVFTDASRDPDGRTLVAWSWAFGDGAGGQGREVAHRFPEGGLYEVRLAVTDADGLTGVLAKPLAVGHAPPAPGFLARVAGPRTVQFTDASAHPNPADAPGPGWTWRWDFGDGASSAVRSPRHEFPAERVYRVRLTVVDDDGQEASLERLVDTANEPPRPAFATDPAKPIAGVPVRFLDRSADPDGAVVAWAWEFGDGNASAEREPLHTYARGGDYLVRLTAQDDQGARATVEGVLHVCETRAGLGEGLGFGLEVCTRVQV